MTTEETWFYLGRDDEQCGPVSRAELMKLVSQGHVPDVALVWRPGFEGWKPLREIEQLRSPDAKAPGPKNAMAPAVMKPAPVKAIQSAAKPAAPKAAPIRKQKTSRKDRTPVAVGAVFAVAAVATVAAMYRYSSPSSPAAKPIEAPPSVIVAQAEPDPAPLPTMVRVKNPFDASEVFEFPPGTRAADAQQQVADILMKRARERQKYLDVRTRTSRRR
jgi:hypothetical protein